MFRIKHNAYVKLPLYMFWLVSCLFVWNVIVIAFYSDTPQTFFGKIELIFNRSESKKRSQTSFPAVEIQKSLN